MTTLVDAPRFLAWCEMRFPKLQETIMRAATLSTTKNKFVNEDLSRIAPEPRMAAKPSAGSLNDRGRDSRGKGWPDSLHCRYATLRPNALRRRPQR